MIKPRIITEDLIEISNNLQGRIVSWKDGLTDKTYTDSTGLQ